MHEMRTKKRRKNIKDTHTLRGKMHISNEPFSYLFHMKLESFKWEMQFDCGLGIIECLISSAHDFEKLNDFLTDARNRRVYWHLSAVRCSHYAFARRYIVTDFNRNWFVEETGTKA